MYRLNRIIKENNLGIVSNSSNNLSVQQTLFNGNLLAGIAFVNTYNSTGSQNNIDGSQHDVFVDAQSVGNPVTDNNVLNNVIDIKNANRLAANATSNEPVMWTSTDNGKNRIKCVS